MTINEWVELYNPGSEDIDMTAWVIIEGSGAKTSLNGSIKTHGWFVVDKPKGNLNNSGDIVELRETNGVLIDSVAYGDWDDGSVSNNAPAARDPMGIARIFDGRNSYNDAEDFSLTSIPTKGTENIISTPNDAAPLAATVSATNGDDKKEVIISEILPDPRGADQDGEFIELYNFGMETIVLDGWRLGDSSSRRYNLASAGGQLAIRPGEYLAVYRSESGIALNNNGDTVNLYSPSADEPVCSLPYGPANEGEGYAADISDGEARISEGAVSPAYFWTQTATPGKANVIVHENLPPEIGFDFPDYAILGQPVLFDSSDTSDPDNDKLAFYWDFGDGATNTLPVPEHTFFRPGEYMVSLAVNDGEHRVYIEKTLIIENPDIGASGGRLIISEFVPNPTGTDSEGEWIEIYNQGGTRVNLRDWRLDDGEGGSRPYTLPAEVWLDPGAYFLFDREETGLALNNTVDSVRLIDRNESIVDEVDYSGVKEGEAFARDETGEWRWTAEATPGSRNVIKIAVPTKAAGQISAKPATAAETRTVTTLEHVHDFEKGDRVKVQGTAAVLPGVLGAQYFYIVGSPGIQVYNYSKDFPEFAVGDLVEVSGEISEAYGEKRIKTAARDDIRILAHQDPPDPAGCRCDEIDENAAGRLVSISGEVVERKGSSLYLDDGTNEVPVYIKEATGIAAGGIKVGDRLMVSGIVNRTASGFRLLPRGREDIELSEAEDSGQILGEIQTDDEWALPPRERHRSPTAYLLIAALAMIALIIVFLLRSRRISRKE